ncbi:hypothetical protein [Streptomyces sp. TLI_146]|uniref:hypothetical protein n=1 Tax=Streptomyces sp. TLI_146 TaxID=1938858 RepID=UPI000CB115E0|nr:hypothetical protein [Streptomyces sp. TLI_146]PKV89900.1 hypothetical protein BX283_7547 [Streptomyces sp. TLI_146]
MAPQPGNDPLHLLGDAVDDTTRKAKKLTTGEPESSEEVKSQADSFADADTDAQRQD